MAKILSFFVDGNIKLKTIIKAESEQEAIEIGRRYFNNVAENIDIPGIKAELSKYMISAVEMPTGNLEELGG